MKKELLSLLFFVLHLPLLYCQLGNTEKNNYLIITGMESISPGIIRIVEKTYNYKSYFGEMQKMDKIAEIEISYNEYGLPILVKNELRNNHTELKYKKSTINSKLILEEVRYPENDWIIWRFKTDNKDNIIEKNEFSSGGDHLKTWNYEYNPKGQITRKTLIKNNISDYPEIQVTDYYYGVNGNMINYYTYAITSNSIAKLHRNKVEFTFNSNSQLVKSIEAFSTYGCKTNFFPDGLDFQHPSGNREKTKAENLKDMNNSWNVIVTRQYSFSNNGTNIWYQKITTSMSKDLIRGDFSEESTLTEREFITSSLLEIQSFLSKTLSLDLAKSLWTNNQLLSIDKQDEIIPSKLSDSEYNKCLNELKTKYETKLKNTNSIDSETHNNILKQLSEEFNLLTEQYIGNRKNEIEANRPKYKEEQKKKEQEAIKLGELELVNRDFLNFRANVKNYIYSTNSIKRIYWSEKQTELLESKKIRCRRSLNEKSKRKGLGLNAWVECDKEFNNKYQNEIIPICEDYFLKIDRTDLIDEKIRLINELIIKYKDSLDIYLKGL